MIERPDWEKLLAAERHLQFLVAGSTLVGGTAAAIHAGHRISQDGDHVLEDLRSRFDDVLAALESASGWQTARIQRPVAEIDLRSYRGLRAPWNDWAHLVTRGRAWAAIVARAALEGGAS